MGIIIRPGRLGRFAGVAGTRASTPQNAFGRGTDFLPTSVPNLVAWYKGDAGVTLGATPLASGTTPPVVTLSGTLAQSTGLYIQIDGAGTLGVATFKWSINNGTSFVATGVLTGASVVLGSTSITAAFAAGAYLTDNIYQAVVATWADQSGNGNNLTQATPANQPLMLTNALNGRPGLQFDGVNDGLRKAGISFSGATGRTTFVVVKYNTAALGGAVLDGGGNQNRMYRITDTTSFAFDFDGAGANEFYASGNVTPQTFAYYTLKANAASSYVKKGSLVVASGNAGTAATLTAISLATFGDGSSTPGAITVPELFIYSTAVDMQTEIRGRQRLAALYGL